MDIRHCISDKIDATQNLSAINKEWHSCYPINRAITSYITRKLQGCYCKNSPLFINNDLFGEIILKISHYSHNSGFNHIRLGVNNRLDTIRTTSLIVKLETLKAEISNHKQLVASRDMLLIEADLHTTPYNVLHTTIVSAQHNIRIPGWEDIPSSAVHFRIPTISKQPVIAEKETDLTYVNQSAEQAIKLTMRPYLGKSCQQTFVTVVRRGQS